MKEFTTSKETERNFRLLTLVNFYLELTVLNHNQDKGELQTPTNSAKIPHKYLKARFEAQTEI